MLKAGKAEDKPNIVEVAVWYFRGQDIEALVGNAQTPTQKLEAVAREFRTRIGLTDEEVAALFTQRVNPQTPDDAFADTAPNPLAYLPGEPEPEPIVAVEDVGSCSLDLVMALAAKNFVILTGPSGTGKSRSAPSPCREHPARICRQSERRDV